MSGVNAEYRLNCGNASFWFSPERLETTPKNLPYYQKYTPSLIKIYLKIPPESSLEIKCINNIKY